MVLIGIDPYPYLNPQLLYKRLTKWIHVGISLSASKKSWPTSWSKKRRFSSCPFCSAESTKMPVKIFLGVKSDANSLKELFGCSTYYYFARLEASLIETDIFHAPLNNFELRSFSLFQSGFVWTYGSHAAYGTPNPMFHCFIFSSCHFFWGQSPSQSAPKPTINTQENSQQISHFLSAAITIYGAPNPKKISPNHRVFIVFFDISRYPVAATQRP